ncbi:MAG: T9SS type A sorting domain-containing protein [Bacteroidota bacterium]
MKKIWIVVVSLCAIGMTASPSYAQSYEVGYNIEVIGPSSGVVEIYIDIETVSGNTYTIIDPFSVFNSRSGTITVSGKPKSLSHRFVRFTSSISCSDSGTTSLASADDCFSASGILLSDQSSNGCQASMSIDLEWEPVLSDPILIKPTSISRNICEDGAIEVQATAGFGNRYNWYYRVDGGDWELINGKNMSREIIRYTDINVPLGQPIAFSYGMKECAGVTGIAFTRFELEDKFNFYEKPPSVKSTVSKVGTAPVCGNGTGSSALGSFTISPGDLSREPIRNEKFTLMVYEGTSKPDFLGTINDSTNLNQLPITVTGSGITYNTSGTTLNLPPNQGSNKYYLFIFPSVTNESTVASGCGSPDFFDFTIPPTDSIEVDIVSRPPVCDNEDAIISLTIRNGVPLYNISISSPPLGIQYSTFRNQSSVDLNVPISVVDTPFDIKLTDRNGCTFETESALPALVNPPAFTVSSGLDTDVVCDGDEATFSVSASLMGTYTYRLHRESDNVVVASGTGDQDGVSFTIGEGRYEVTALNENGCLSSNRADAVTGTTIPVAVRLDGDAIPPTCEGGDDGRFTIMASGGSGSGYKYSIDGVTYQDEATFDHLTSGDYQVTARDGVSCQSAILTVSLPEPDNPLRIDTVHVTRQNYCKGPNEEDGILEVFVENAEGTVSYQLKDDVGDVLIPGQGFPIFAGLEAGTYRLAVIDDRCTSLDTIVTIGITEIISATISMEPVRCNGETNGRLTIADADVLGGVPYREGFNYRYSWREQGDPAATVLSTDAFLEAGAGDYEIIITDSLGCSEVFRETITEPEALEVTHGFSNITCHDADDGTITLTEGGGNGGNTYLWSDGATTKDRAGLAAGTYSVTIADSKSCSVTINDIVIINPDPLNLKISAQANVGCKNESTGSIRLRLTGGTGSYAYQLNGGTFQSAPVFENLPDGDYTVIARDSVGCTEIVRTTITEPSEVLSLTFDSNVNATCDTDGEIRAVVSGGTMPYRYTWRDNTRSEAVPDTDESITVPAGEYILTVEDANKCIVEATRNLTSNDGAMVTILNQVQPTCSYLTDGSATISLSGVPPFTTTWDHGETGESPTQLAVGDNWFSVVDANDCLIRDRVSFSTPEPLEVTLVSETLPTCQGDGDGTLTVAVNGGNGNYALAWDHGPTSTTLTDLSAGDYTVRVNDDKGCELVKTFTLADKELLELTLLPEDPSCEGTSDGSIEAVPTGGNGGYTYRWSTGSTTKDLENLPEGTYTVEVTDEKGCSTSATVALDDPDQTIFALEDLRICSGQSYKVSTPVTALSYQWTGPGGFNETGSEAIVSVPGTYELLIEDLIGCPSSAPFEVVIDDDALLADFLVTGTAFVGDTLILIDISWPIPDSIRWELPEEAQVISRTADFAELVFDAPGTYSVAMFGELAGCNASYQQVITVEERPVQDVQSFVFAAPSEPAISKLEAYPNPAADRFTVELSLRETDQAVVQLVDIEGNRIAYRETLTGRKTYALRLDTRLMSPGMYFLQAKVGKETKTIRVLVK